MYANFLRSDNIIDLRYIRTLSYTWLTYEYMYVNYKLMGTSFPDYSEHTMRTKIN